LHAASWLISIFAGFGAAPAKVTVPLTVAAVAGSIGVEVGAGGACEVGEVACSWFSFLLQPASSQKPNRESMNIATQVFLFMMSPF
jgi:hypothetical protein